MAEAIIYGIANCDTVKKARRWLEQHNIECEFHDFRRDGLTQKQIESWFNKVDWQILLNKRSRTWRELADEDKNNITKSKASKLMLQQPSLIKRPVLVYGKEITVGFDDKIYKKIFDR